MLLPCISLPWNRQRLERLQAAMQNQRLDAMFLFAQESIIGSRDMTASASAFSMPRREGGRYAWPLVSHPLGRSAPGAPDLAHRGYPASGKTPRYAAPAAELKAIAAELGLAGRRIGVEYETQGLTHGNGRRSRPIDGFAALEDRLDHRTGAESGEIAGGNRPCAARRGGAFGRGRTRRRSRACGAGPKEGDILAAMHDAIFRAGGDYAANEFIIGSGEDALLCRYKSGRRKLDAQDQLTLEFAGTWHHYHAALMRTHVLGAPRPLHIPYPRGGARGPRRLRSGAAAWPHGRRGVRGPCAHARSSPALGAPPQRLRLSRSARNSRPPGWTRRCSTRRTTSCSNPA